MNWRLGLALMLAGTPLPAQAQMHALRAAAERAREAWMAHDVVALVATSPRLLVQLPGAQPSAALGRGQASALLSDYLAPAEEVQNLVRAAREIEPGRGYVELQRQYRVAGTQEVRVQSLLLAYRLGPAGWSLVELRVLE